MYIVVIFLDIETFPTIFFSQSHFIFYIVCFKLRILKFLRHILPLRQVFEVTLPSHEQSNN